MGRDLADCLAHGSAMWAGLVAHRRQWKIGVAHKRSNGLMPRSDAEWKWKCAAFFVAGSRSVCDKHLHSGGKGDMVCNVGVWIAKRLRLCAASFEECCKQRGKEVLLQTGGRLDHLLVFADVSIQPLQGMRKVKRKRHICDVRIARFDGDKVQRFEAAVPLAPALPSTFSVDHHADVLARYVRQTVAEVFPKAMARRKKDWISDDTWKLILAKKPILIEQRKARAWQDLCRLWKAWAAWAYPTAAESRAAEASRSIAASLRTVAVQRCKVAELTDQVRKAIRDDWRAHVDRQAEEAHNAASGHNSEKLYQVVKNLACKQSRGFRCTRIRLEDGTLASRYGEAQARWLRFHAGNFDAKIQSEQEYNAALLRHRLRRLLCESNFLSSFESRAWHQHFRDILSRLRNEKRLGKIVSPMRY